MLLVGCGALAISCATARADSFVEFDYNISLATRARGSVFIELFDDRPNTTANFLQYVNAGLYNDTLMHRLAIDQTTGNPFILQGGGYYPQYVAEPDPLSVSLNPNLTVDLDGDYATPNPTVANEFGNAPLRSNVAGTIAMAKLGNDPNSASNQYFFNLGDNSANLDFQNGGFTVFAQVVGDGMSLINVYANQLPILNMNPDTNDDGTRDAGPFDSLPALVNGNTFLPLIVNRAKVVDYLGSGLTTDVPASGLTFANKDAFIDTGTVFTGTGSITIGVGRTLGVRENYVINRSVINHGTLAPGLALGVIGISSTYFQYSDGTLSIQLAGTTADTLYDKLTTNSTAFLAGKLQISLLNGFTPALGNSFTVLTASSIIGSFGTYDLPQLTSGQAWKINQSATAISLTVVEGDYNHNGVVDADDYVVWRKTRNASVTPYSGADGNGDGIINDADLAIWRTNLGAIGGGVHGAGSSAGGLTTGNVPEPSSGLLILSAVLLYAGLMRRRSAFR